MNIKAVIDTNVLVSSFLSKNQKSPTVRIANAILAGKFTLVYSQEMLEEYEDVLGRSYLKLPSENVEALLAHIRAIGEAVTPADTSEDFPDPDDKVFYCTAIASEAKLVTGNLKHYPKSAIVVTPAEFCELAQL